MFGADGDDKLVELRDVPQSSVGAPCPVVLADEYHIFLAYFLRAPAPNWDSSTVRVVGLGSETEPVALVSFVGPYAHQFGPPNDETISGHRLYNKGLEPYSVFEVENSSWIAALEKMNSVHPEHSKDNFSSLKHYIFTFHDSVFECVCESYSVSCTSGSLIGVISEVANQLG